MRWPFVVLSRARFDEMESALAFYRALRDSNHERDTDLIVLARSVESLKSLVQNTPALTARYLREQPPAVLSPVVVQPLSLDLANRARMRELDAIAARDKE